MIGFGQSAGEYFATVAMNLGRQASLFFKGGYGLHVGTFPRHSGVAGVVRGYLNVPTH